MNDRITVTDEQVEALKGTLASLVATLSIINRAQAMNCRPSMAVASNKMFRQMLKDYDSAIANAHRVLEQFAAAPKASAPEGWTRADLATALAALDGVVLLNIRSTVGPESDANNWREYLSQADDVMAHLSAAAPTPPAVTEAVLAEREACAKIAKDRAMLPNDCEALGPMDWETGQNECSLEARGRDCLCQERLEAAEEIEAAIRARSAIAPEEE